MTIRKTESTRELLLDSAGELFAEKGFDGVSTRMIAERAGVKLSAIHYHFGSKEKLYREACLACHSRGRLTSIGMVLEENPMLMESPEGQAEAIRSTVFRSFHDHFTSNRPDWETKLVIRELVDPTAALELLAEVVFKPDTESSMAFYKAVRPGATDAEAATWSDLLYGPVILYKISGKAMDLARISVARDETFYRTAATRIARMMILDAGLPLPADLA